MPHNVEQHMAREEAMEDFQVEGENWRPAIAHQLYECKFSMTTAEFFTFLSRVLKNATVHHVKSSKKTVSYAY